MNHFFERVYEVVKEIPRGKVMSYGQIARALGVPNGARQVGWAMRVCPDEICWQRVVKMDGSVAGGQYAPVRRRMLEEEGVLFLEDGRVNMQSCCYNWGDFHADI